MKIIFVRHGHPNYVDDCLTELGHTQAEAADERLKQEKIDAFYSSSCGRAYETAVHIANRHGKEVVKLDFMREIQWGPKGGQPHADYNPWAKVSEMVECGMPVMDSNWEDNELMKDNFVSERIRLVGDNFDKWLSQLGYEREGDYYRVKRVNQSCIMLASHGGSSSSVFARIFNIPFPCIAANFRIDFTGISEVHFENKIGGLISPKIALFNDSKHLNNIDTDNKFDM